MMDTSCANSSQIIYDTESSKITIRRAPLLLADKTTEQKEA